MAVRFGITTMAVDPPGRFRELVRAVEDGGFDYLWVCDSSLHARDAHAFLTLVATDTTRLRFGPNCTHPYTRHPAINLNALATLHELSGGRAILSVGVGDRPVTELGYRMAPVAVVREMIGVLRALQGGDLTHADGPTFPLKNARLSVPLPSPLPVYISASGPRMLHLAGELADGVLFLSGVHPPCVEYALEQIGAGVARGERDSAALDVGCTIAGSLRNDVGQARAECIPMAAWFPETAPQYAELAGVPPETTEQIKAAYAGGHFDGAKAAFRYVTDDMVDRFTVAGPAELWVQRINQVIAVGVDHINIFLLSRDTLGMVRNLSAKVLPYVRDARAASVSRDRSPAP